MLTLIRLIISTSIVVEQTSVPAVHLLTIGFNPLPRMHRSLPPISMVRASAGGGLSNYHSYLEPCVECYDAPVRSQRTQAVNTALYLRLVPSTRDPVTNTSFNAVPDAFCFDIHLNILR
jgi:hypothetical protein